MNPDPQVVAAIRYQLTRLLPIEHDLAANAVHPPSIAARDWAGAAAEAHAAELAALHRLLRSAHDAVADAVAVTRRELGRAGG